MVLIPPESSNGLRLDLDLSPKKLEALRNETKLKDNSVLFAATENGPMTLFFAAQKKVARVAELKGDAVKHQTKIPALEPFFMQFETMAPPTPWQKISNQGNVPRKQRMILGLTEIEEVDDDMSLQRFEQCRPFSKNPAITISQREFAPVPAMGKTLNLLVVRTEQIALDDGFNQQTDRLIDAVREQFGQIDLSKLMLPGARMVGQKREQILEYRNAEPVAIFTVKIRPSDGESEILLA